MYFLKLWGTTNTLFKGKAQGYICAVQIPFLLKWKTIAKDENSFVTKYDATEYQDSEYFFIPFEEPSEPQTSVLK